MRKFRKDSWLNKEARRRGITVHELVQRSLIKEDFYDGAATKRNNYAKSLLKKQVGGELVDLRYPIYNQKTLDILDEKIRNQCGTDKGCLAAARQGFDLTAGSLFDLPKMNDIFQKRGITSFKEGDEVNMTNARKQELLKTGYLNPYNPQEKGYNSLDSWEFAKYLADTEGLVHFKPSKEKPNLFARNDADAEYIKNLKLPVGTWVGFGPTDPNQGYFPNSPSVKAGFGAQNHSAEVIGYDEDGQIVLSDYGQARTLKQAMQDGITSIITPKEYIGKDFNYYKNLKETETNGVNMKPSYSISPELKEEIGYDEGEMQPFLSALTSNKEKMVKRLGIKPEQYDAISKRLIALSGLESEFGTGFMHNIEDSIAPSGNSLGLSQLKWDNIAKDEQLSKLASEFGIIKESDLTDPKKFAAAAMLYGWKHNAYANAAYKKGMEPSHRYYSRNEEDIKNTVRDPNWENGTLGRDTLRNIVGNETFKMPRRWFGNDEKYAERVNKKLKEDPVLGPSGVRYEKLLERKKNETDPDVYNNYIVKPTAGNSPDLTEDQIFFTGWQGYNSLKSGDTQLSNGIPLNFYTRKADKILKGIQSKEKGGPIVDPMGQWKHPYKETIVPTKDGRITMQGVPYPVLGMDETGMRQLMQPGGEYKFKGQYVYEVPMMQQGGRLIPSPNQQPIFDSFSSSQFLRNKTSDIIDGKRIISEQNKPTIRPYTKRNKLEKTAAIVSNPFTAIKYATEGRGIPDNFERGPRVGFDYAADFIPTSAALNIYNIPKDIEEGNYGKAALSALPALFPASALGKRLQNSPLPRLLKNNLRGGNKYGYQRAGALLGTTLAAEVAPIVSKIPGLRKPYKDLAYHFASRSGGSPGLDITTMLQILNKKGPKAVYKGSLQEGNLTADRGRNLLKQYIYGNQPEFIPSKEIPRGLESYTNRYGKMGVYELDSKIGNNNVVEYTKDFNKLLDNKQIKDNQPFSLDSYQNPLSPYDDIAGHMGLIENNNGNRDFITQDIWKFTPEDYGNKWAGGGDRDAYRFLDEYDYLRRKQAKLMDNAGKPFILMSRNPLANSSKFNPVEALNNKNIDEMIDKQGTYTELNLDKFQKGGAVAKRQTRENPYINYKKVFNLALRELFPKKPTGNNRMMVTENTAPSMSQMRGNPNMNMQQGGVIDLFDQWDEEDEVKQNTAPAIEEVEQQQGFTQEDIDDAERKGRRKSYISLAMEDNPYLLRQDDSDSNSNSSSLLYIPPPSTEGTTLNGNSIAARHNNPGNIKYADWMKEFGAVPGDPGKDGGRFAKFPSIDAGLKARQYLLQSRPIYKNKTVDQAMRMYSNNGYDGNIYPEIKNKMMSELTQSEFEELTKRQLKREDVNVAKQLGIYKQGGTYETTPEELAELRRQGYDFTIKY